MHKHVIPLLFLLVACGGGQKQDSLATAQVGIQTALSAAAVAADAFVAWDSAHQDAIVAGATSLEDGKARLAAYRARREAVELAFDAFDAAADAALAALAVTSPDPATLAELAARSLRAVLAVRAAFAALKGHVP